MVLEKISSKYWEFYKECKSHRLFCHLAISQFSMADISSALLTQIAQFNQLFQRLNLWRMHANVKKCKQWREQRFAYKQRKLIGVWRNKDAWVVKNTNR